MELGWISERDFIMLKFICMPHLFFRFILFYGLESVIQLYTNLISHYVL